jgi:hypothetical protein
VRVITPPSPVRRIVDAAVLLTLLVVLLLGAACLLGVFV